MSTQVAQFQQESKQMMSYGILNPTNLAEAMEMANIMSSASIVPQDFKGNPGNILIAMQWGMELGLAPLQAMQNIAVINGRPSLWGDAMIGIVRGASICEYVKETVEGTGENMIATCKAKRKDQDEEVRTFSVADAKQAGLWGKKGPWCQYPKRMLQLRARGFAIRDVFADVLKGMECAEEQQDIERLEKDITPPRQSSEPRALPNYSQEDFEAKFDTWKGLIESGKHGAEDIILKIESKGILSDDQKTQLRNLEA